MKERFKSFKGKLKRKTSSSSSSSSSRDGKKSSNQEKIKKHSADSVKKKEQDGSITDSSTVPAASNIPSTDGADGTKIARWQSESRVEPRVLHGKSSLLLFLLGTVIGHFVGYDNNSELHSGLTSKYNFKILCTNNIGAGYTLTESIPFRSVCESIRKYAFAASNLPVIVSLEVHTSAPQQEMMVDIMNECFQGMLVDLPGNTDVDSLPQPKLQDLMNKILVKVKYSPKPPPTGAPEPTELAKTDPTHWKCCNCAAQWSLSHDTQCHDCQHHNCKQCVAITYPSVHSSNASSDELAKLESGTNKTTDAAPSKSKIIESLGRFGIYTRSYRFQGFNRPEAKEPNHVFSLSEKKLIEVHQNDAKSLFAHNKNFLLRTYPKGLRINSSNLDPTVFWRKGVQIVALNWQKWDAGMMLNEAMFAGSRGWVAKPAGYRSSSDAALQRSASHYGVLDLEIEFFCGQNLSPPEGEDPGKFKPYVKVELHVETLEERTEVRLPDQGRAKEGQYKQKTKTAKAGSNPDFLREKIVFEHVDYVAPELSFIR
jgi:hypothetical protein